MPNVKIKKNKNVSLIQKCHPRKPTFASSVVSIHFYFVCLKSLQGNYNRFAAHEMVECAFFL